MGSKGEALDHLLLYPWEPTRGNWTAALRLVSRSRLCSALCAKLPLQQRGRSCGLCAFAPIVPPTPTQPPPTHTSPTHPPTYTTLRPARRAATTCRGSCPPGTCATPGPRLSPWTSQRTGSTVSPLCCASCYARCSARLRAGKGPQRCAVLCRQAAHSAHSGARGRARAQPAPLLCLQAGCPARGWVQTSPFAPSCTCTSPTTGWGQTKKASSYPGAVAQVRCHESLQRPAAHRSGR